MAGANCDGKRREVGYMAAEHIDSKGVAPGRPWIIGAVALFFAALQHFAPATGYG